MARGPRGTCSRRAALVGLLLLGGAPWAILATCLAAASRGAAVVLTAMAFEVRARP